MEAKKSLFVINQEYLNLIEQVDQETGEITPEVAEALTLTIKDAALKAGGYIAIIKKFESDIEVLKQYEEQISLLKRRAEKKIEFLKTNLLHAVMNFGEIHTELYKLSIRKSESVEIINITEIPNEYKVIKMNEQADKMKIKKALQNGEEIKGAELIEKNNLQIK